MRKSLENDKYLQTITSIDVGIRMEIEAGRITVPSFSEYENFREFITHLEVTRSEN